MPRTMPNTMSSFTDTKTLKGLLLAPSADEKTKVIQVKNLAATLEAMSLKLAFNNRSE